LNNGNASFFVVKSRANTEFKGAKTDRYSDKIVIVYGVPLEIRRKLASWRVKVRFYLKNWGIYRKGIGYLFPSSMQEKVRERMEKYKEEYEEIVKGIPNEELRREYKCVIRYENYVPPQPETSEVIANIIKETMDQVKEDVDALRACVLNKDFIEIVKEFENEIKFLLIKEDCSVMELSKESIMLFANICALATHKNLDAKRLRSLKTSIAKLELFMPPLDEGSSRLMKFTHSLISKVKSERPLKVNEVKRLLSSFKPLLASQSAA
jgi:hypothetical protein